MFCWTAKKAAQGGRNPDNRTAACSNLISACHILIRVQKISTQHVLKHGKINCMLNIDTWHTSAKHLWLIKKKAWIYPLMHLMFIFVHNLFEKKMAKMCNYVLLWAPRLEVWIEQWCPMVQKLMNTIGIGGWQSLNTAPRWQQIRLPGQHELFNVTLQPWKVHLLVEFLRMLFR